MKLFYGLTVRTVLYMSDANKSCRMCNGCIGVVMKYHHFKEMIHLIVEDSYYICEYFEKQIDVFTAEYDEIICSRFKNFNYIEL